MRNNVPKVRLQTAVIGDRVKLAGDSTNRTFTVEALREDGYYDLFCNGRPSVITCPSTEIIFVNA